MDISLSWLDEKQSIILYEMTGVWDWQDFYAAYKTTVIMKKSVRHRVHTFVDLRDCGRLPQDCISHARAIVQNKTDNAGISVLISNDRFIHLLYQAAGRIEPQIGQHFRIANSIDEAYRLLANIDKRC